MMKLMLGKAPTAAKASGYDWTKKACDLLAFSWLHEAAQNSPMLVSMATSGLKLVSSACWWLIGAG